jgi:hypothetical protein
MTDQLAESDLLRLQLQYEREKTFDLEAAAVRTKLAADRRELEGRIRATYGITDADSIEINTGVITRGTPP